MKKQEEFLKQQLIQFVTKHSSDVLLCGIDEIVLSYLVSILEQLGYEDSAEDLFDVDEFTEMMEAYLPGFCHIDSVSVSEWIFDLANKLKGLDEKGDTCTSQPPATSPALVPMTTSPFSAPPYPDTMQFTWPEPRGANNPFKDLLTRPLSLPNGDLSSSLQLALDKQRRTHSLSETEAPPQHMCNGKGQRSRTTSSSSSYGSERKRTQSSSSTASSNGAMTNGDFSFDIDATDLNGDTNDQETVTILLEMFPRACAMEVNHCLSIAYGDMENAAQLILSRQECGQSISEQASKKKGKKPGSKKSSISFMNDPRMKETIINKYSYVDVDTDAKEHKPAAPKTGDKKMIRYLDGKIVSTKGERFTEIKKEDDEKMKKTYVNLKPAKQYRFH